EIGYSDERLERDIAGAVEVSPAHPVLIDRFLEDAIEVDVDAVCDGTDVYIGGILEHIEEAGVHSGDSACVLPPHSLGDATLAAIVAAMERLSLALGVRGLINAQFAVKHGEVMGIDAELGLAFAKSQAAGGWGLPSKGTVFVSVADRDKAAIVAPVRSLVKMGFEVVSTAGTAARLGAAGIPVRRVGKYSEGPAASSR